MFIDLVSCNNAVPVFEKDPNSRIYLYEMNITIVISKPKMIVVTMFEVPNHHKILKGCRKFKKSLSKNINFMTVFYSKQNQSLKFGIVAYEKDIPNLDKIKFSNGSDLNNSRKMLNLINVIDVIYS